MVDTKKCPFCHTADDGSVARWHHEAIMECDVKSADIYLDDGITVILHTPKFESDQRLHIDADYCPACGRKYGKKENELEAAKADLALMAEKGECIVCSHYRTDWPKPGCELNGLNCIWSWRGVQKDD